MKLTAFLLMVSFLHVGAATVAQKITIDKKQTSLSSVFKEIGRQSGYDFFYDTDLLASAGLVDIHVTNADIRDALDKCLSGQPFTYTIEDKIVVIKRKNTPILTEIRELLQLPHPINGKVLDENGQPLSGATIKIKGSNTGVASNEQGLFTVSVNTDNAVLVISFIGYDAQEVRVDVSSDNLIIRLRHSNTKLDEFVVTDSYGAQQRNAYTGAATVVSSAAVNNKPYTSPLQALQGQVAGLNITSSMGQPGANVQARLRGVGSIGLDANPLYVVDGIIINAGDLSRLASVGGTNVLAGINNDDIESVTVLKDASAAAIYGSRGANGVVLITTKKGKNGKTQVNIDNEVGSTNILPLPAGGKPLDAAGYSTLTVEGLLNSGVSPTSTTNGIPFYTSSYGLFQRGTNWYDLVTRNGKQQQYNISVSGGDEKTRVFASAGYFRQEATVIGSQMSRITGLLNVDHTINKRISFSVNLNGSNIEQRTPLDGNQLASPMGAVFNIRPTQNAYNPDGSVNTSIIGNTNFPTYYNPIYIAAHDRNSDAQTRLLGALTGRYTIWQNLKFTTTLGADYNVLEENQFNNPVMGDGRTVLGQGLDYYTRYFNWTYRNQLDYRWDIPKAENFHADLTLGYEAQKSKGYYISAQSNKYPLTQPLLTSSVNASSTITGNSSFSNYTFNSFYSRGSLNYQSKYVLSGSFRRDGSSRFGQGHQYGNFWSVGGAWNLEQESFFAKQRFLSSARLRTSYGLLGNAGTGVGNNVLGNYTAQPAATYGASYAGSPGQNFSTVGNTLITWESSKELDLGADLGFFKDRLIVSFDYYNRTIDGLIQSAPISRTVGFSSVVQNIGNMHNRGEEFSITGIPVKTANFKWTTSFNIAMNKNIVTRLANHAAYYNIIDFHVKEGSDFYTWSMPIYAGANPANGEPLWYTNATKTATTNAYNLANLRVDQKQGDPKFFGGWSNTFSYKGFSVTGDLYFSGGNYVYNSYAYNLNDGTQYTYGKYAYNLRRWTTPGQVTDVPKYVAGGGTQADGATLSSSSSLSTRFLYKGDYIRLKNLTAGYDLSVLGKLKKYGLSKLYLYGRATNLWTKTFDSRLPFDPEVGVTGIATIEVPQVRTFTIGLNIGL